MPTTNERLIRQLAAEIDSDEPPGIAARNLARAVVCLVQGRDGPEAVLLEHEINKLHAAYPNP
jgi:hypothetical protein